MSEENDAPQGAGRRGRGGGIAAVLGWLAGLAWQLHEPVLQPVATYAFATALGLALTVAGLWLRSRIVLVAVGMAVLALGSTGWRATARLAEALPQALEGADLVVVGTVEGLPQFGSTGARFLFAVDEARTAGGEAASLPRQLSLAWYGAYQQPLAADAPQRGVQAGQRWRMTVRLKRPHGLSNPHGFDQELHLFERGIRATGSVRGEPVRLAAASGHLVDRLRQHVRESIEARVDDARAAGVIAALAVGDQAAIDRDDWQLFRTTGTAHVMSISGLHVTMFAWAAGGLVESLWRRSARAPLVCPAPIAGQVGGLLLAAAYAVFSGWGVPAQRTLWMLAAVVLLRAGGCRWPWPRVLLAACFVVTAADPWALLQPGFWLSFAAVGLLMASARAHTTPAPIAAAAGWRGLLSRLGAHAAGGVRTQAVATLGLAPLTLVFFGQISVVGFAANLLTIPLVTLVVTPLALLGAFWPPLWSVAAEAVKGLTLFLAWTASMPGAMRSFPVAPLWAQLAALAGAALLLAPLPWRLRLLGGVLAVPLALPAPPRPPEGTFELLAADVGQGSAVLVRTHRHLLVYDTGPQYGPESDAGQRVLLPLLRSRGEGDIDRLVLSHRDTDHVGGAAALLAEWPVRAVLASLEDGHPLTQAGPPFERCEAGQRWTWDGVRFEVLHPAAADHGRAAKPNTVSCVLRIEAAQGRALLAGDIERDQEAALVARHADRLRAEVLLLPHHGSRTSSTPDFLRAVSPAVAVVQAGYRNRFNHPAPEVVDRLGRQGIGVVSTPECGAWTWQAGDDVSRARCHREAAPRYWHLRPG